MNKYGLSPPKYAQWFLRQCVSDKHQLEVTDDLTELFHLRVSESSLLNAHLLYWKDVMSIWLYRSKRSEHPVISGGTMKPLSSKQTLVWWLLASSVGWLIIGMMPFLLFAMVSGMDDLAFATWGPIIGLPILFTSYGVMQWLVLRRHMTKAVCWIWASAAGFILMGIVIFGLQSFWVDSKVPGMYGCLTIGVCMGFMQWLVLRRHLAGAGWWIWASISGWLIVGLIVGGNTSIDLANISDALKVIGVLAIPSAVTGMVLVWLLRQNANQTSLA